MKCASEGTCLVGGGMMGVECWLLIKCASEGTCLVGSLLGCCMLNDARRGSVVEWGIS